MSALDAVRTAECLFYHRQWDIMYWAVDLHGTLLHSSYDNTDLTPQYYPHAKETMALLSREPRFKFILYTCSYEENIKELIRLMGEDCIRFDFINDNPEAENTKYGDFRKKPYFNVLLDDKAGFDPHTEWLEIFNFYTGLIK
jgi:hypothetical protein